MRNILVLLSLLTSVHFLTPQNVASEVRRRGMMLSPSATAADIEDLVPYKVNFVRLPLQADSADTDDRAAYLSWLESQYERVDSVLDAAAANHIQVLIELHSPPGGYETRISPAQYRIFSDQWAQDTLSTTWAALATRYRNHPAIWGFQIINEPAVRRVASGLLNWSALALKVAKEIRAIDPVHKIVVPPIFADIPKLGSLRPLRVKGIVYSVHMYYPQKYTSQGTGAFPLGVVYPSRSINKATLEKYVAPLIRFQKLNRATILIHEFSAARWAPGAAKYLTDITTIIEKNKWHWAYHAFRESDTWDVELGNVKGDLTPSPTITDRAAVLRARFARNTF